MSDFTTTNWSVVHAANAGNPVDSAAALKKLCERYRRPVLAYFKRLADSTADAEDLTQSFFTKLLEQQLYKSANPERGRFRYFLKSAISNFYLTHVDSEQAQKRAHSDDIPAPAEQPTPDQLFDAAWIKTVVSASLQRLRTEAESSGKLDTFEAVLPFLLERAQKRDYTEAAGDLRANTLAVHVHRMKQRLRELVRAELVDTVSNARDLELELRELRPGKSGAPSAE
jgi:RNA polymerase sigma factor (sigma-70 family)